MEWNTILTLGPIKLEMFQLRYTEMSLKRSDFIARINIPICTNIQNVKTAISQLHLTAGLQYEGSSDTS